MFVQGLFLFFWHLIAILVEPFGQCLMLIEILFQEMIGDIFGCFPPIDFLTDIIDNRFMIENMNSTFVRVF